MWSGALRQAGGLRWPSLARVRNYACQSLAEQLSITARPRPPQNIKQARVEYWNSGRLPVQVRGDKLGPLWLSVPYKDYMKMARLPHIQRKLMRIDMEDENGVATGETLQVLTDRVHEKVPIETKWLGEYDYVEMQRWPRNPPLRLRIPIMITNEDKCPELKGGYYAHEFFAAKGLPCMVNDPENIPMYLEGSMADAVGGDLRVSRIKFPPGVTPVPPWSSIRTQGENMPGHAYPDFLVCRAIRIGSKG